MAYLLLFFYCDYLYSEGLLVILCRLVYDALSDMRILKFLKMYARDELRGTFERGPRLMRARVDMGR